MFMLLNKILNFLFTRSYCDTCHSLYCTIKALELVKTDKLSEIWYNILR